MESKKEVFIVVLSMCEWGMVLANRVLKWFFFVPVCQVGNVAKYVPT